MDPDDANSQATGGVLQFKKRRRVSKKKKGPLTVQDVKRISAKMVRNTLEHKHHEFTTAYVNGTAPYPTDTNGRIDDMTAITQGILDTDRIGDQLTYTSITMRMLVFSPNTSTQQTGFFVRSIGFLWREDSVPVIGDILQTTSSIVDIISSYEYHSKTVRKILWDKTVTLFDQPVITGGTVGYRTTQNSWVDKFYINLTQTLNKKDRVLMFDPAATIYGYNKLYHLLLTNAPAAANGWQIYNYAQIYFIDG